MKLLWQDMSGLPKLHTQSGFDTVCLPSIGFKIRTSFLPASSCTVSVRDERLTKKQVESAIISRDSDWEKRDVHKLKPKNLVPDARSWTQCTRQDEDSFVYSVSLIQGSLSMAVKTLKDDDGEPSYDCKSASEEG